MKTHIWSILLIEMLPNLKVKNIHDVKYSSSFGGIKSFDAKLHIFEKVHQKKPKKT